MRYLSGFLLLIALVGCDNTPTAAPDFSIAVSGELSVNQAGDASTTVTITRKNGFSGAIQLILENADGSALPTGLSPTFSTPTASSVLTIAADATVAAQVYNLRIRAVGGGLTKTASLNLTVNPAPSFDISLSSSSLNLTKGSSATLSVSVNPNATFLGDIALSLERSDASALPDGLAAGFSPLSGGNSTLTLSATALAAAGSYSLQVKATGGGLSKTAPLSVQVSNAPSFNLSLSKPTVTVAQGGSGSLTVNLERLNGFAGAVTLSLENQDGSALAAGITPTFTPASATGNSSSLAVGVGGTVAAGSYSLRVRGTSGALSATALLGLIVSATSTVQVEVTTRKPSLDGTPNSSRGDPGNVAFFAYQEGNNPWKILTGTNGVYRFNIGGDGRYGVLALCLDTVGETGNRNTELLLAYLNTSEATSMTLCALPKFSNTSSAGVKGYVHGLSTANPSASVNTWNITGATGDPAPAQYFELGTLQGPYALFASRFPANSGNPKVANKALLIRDLNLNTTTFLVQDVDFASPATFDLEGPYTATITGGTAPFGARVDFAGTVGRVILANGFGVQSSSFSYRTVPVAQRRSGDYHIAEASVTGRKVVRTIENGTNLTLNLPPFIGASVGFTGGLPRSSWSGTNPDLQWARYMQDIGSNRLIWRVAVSKSWLGTSKNWSLPNFSGLTGWQSRWELTATQGFAWWNLAISTNKPIGEIFPDAQIIQAGGTGSAYLTKANQSYAVSEESGTFTP